MTRDDFLAYIEAYNSDKSRLKDYYAPDLVFENPAFTLSGPDWPPCCVTRLRLTKRRERALRTAMQ